MFKNFYPDYFLDSVYEYDFNLLYGEGYRLIIFDIDNTLVEHGAPATERAIKLFENLRNTGFKTALLSNNDEERVKSFALDVKADMYIHKANKPFKASYLRAMEELGEKKETTFFIGDQLFTDIYGAKKLGIKCAVVKPIGEKEEIQIVFKRKLEKFIYFCYDKKYKKKRLGK